MQEAAQTESIQSVQLKVKSWMIYVSFLYLKIFKWSEDQNIFSWHKEVFFFKFFNVFILMSLATMKATKCFHFLQRRWKLCVY